MPGTRPNRRLVSARGTTLVETLVAAAIALLVLLLALGALDGARKSWARNEARSVAAQSAHLALDHVTELLSAAGRDIDRTPSGADEPRAPDEALEYAGPHAVAVRANFDADEGDGGRELGLEVASAEGPARCRRVVTTGNDEVILLALGKDSDQQAPPGVIAMRWDRSGTASAADASTRDATLSADGEPLHEEDIAFDRLAVDGLTDPPHVLYRLWLDDRGGVVRQPLADGVRELQFAYFDAGGVELDADALGGGDAGRAARASIRRIAVRLSCSSESTRADQGPAVTTFSLEASVSPPALGALDGARRTRAPDAVSEVAACGGQCGAVRVSFLVAAEGPRPSSASVSLHEGPPGEEGLQLASTVIALRAGHRGLAGQPEEAILTTDEHPALAGVAAVHARVVALGADGAASGPAWSSDNADPALRRALLTDSVRPELPLVIGATGFAPEANGWPDAAPDGAGQPGVATAEDGRFAALPAVVSVTLQAPAFALDHGGGAPGAPWDWTARSAGTHPALACHAVPVSSGSLRTPLAELSQADAVPNVYVFRVSGASPQSWGAATPWAFVPSAANLHDLAHLRLQPGAERSYVDRTLSHFAVPADARSPRDHRFDGSTVLVRPRGAEAPAVAAVTPGEVYYYRVRVVDRCWRDADRDGVHDASPDPRVPLCAWSGPLDQGDAWRQVALSLAPFAPPLQPAGASGPEAMLPDPSTDDPDVPGAEAHALPGLALPARTEDNWLRPAAPTEFSLTRRSETGGLLPDGGTRLVFNATRRTEPEAAGGAWAPLAITRYRLVRKGLASRAPGPAELDFPAGLGEVVLDFRAGTAAALAAYTLDCAREEAPSPSSHARLTGLADECPGQDENGTALPFAYRLVALQSADVEDGVDTSAVEASEPSAAYIFPCPLQQAVAGVVIEPSSADLSTQAVTAEVAIGGALRGGATACGGASAARLLAFSATTADFVGTSDWRPVDAASCRADFWSGDLSRALRGSPGRARLAVELSDDWRDATRRGFDLATGCRLRSDLIAGGPQWSVLPVACEEDCGTASGPSALILGGLDETGVSLSEGGTLLSLSLDNRCREEDFSLLQIEVDLRRADGVLPALVSARLAGGLGAPLSLPAPDVGPGASDLDGADGFLRLRWHGSLQELPGGVPTVARASERVVLALSFAGSACGAVVEAFNFRVAGRSAGTREILCSSRIDEPRPPGASVGVLGPGRISVPVATGGCECRGACIAGDDAGLCPLADGLDEPGVDPAPVLDIAGTDGTTLRIRMLTTCSDCELSPVLLRFTLEAADAGDCSDAAPLPALATARLMPAAAGDPPQVLPPPSVRGEREPCQRSYAWPALSGVSLPAGDDCILEFRFEQPLPTVRLVDLRLDFGPPLPADAWGRPPRCDAAEFLPIVVRGW